MVNDEYVHAFNNEGYVGNNTFIPKERVTNANYICSPREDPQYT